MNPGTAALTRSVKMLGRTRCGRGVAVAAVHGGVDGALASGPVDHPVPNILVPLETQCEKNVSTKHAFRRSGNIKLHERSPGTLMST